MLNCWCSSEDCALHGCRAVRQQQGRSIVNPIGWTYPVCHKGNAPDVRGGEHCAAPGAPVDGTTNAAGLATGKYVVVSNVADERYRKIQIRRAGE